MTHITIGQPSKPSKEGHKTLDSKDKGPARVAFSPSHDPRDPRTALPWTKVPAAVALVQEVRTLFGKRAAMRLWCELGLPAPAKLTAPSAPTLPDTIAEFMEDKSLILHCHPSEIQATCLYQAYVDWCLDRDQRAETCAAFGRRLSVLGYEKVKRCGRMFYRGVELVRAECNRDQLIKPAKPARAEK